MSNRITSAKYAWTFRDNEQWQGQVSSLHRPPGLVSSLVWGYGVGWIPRLMAKSSHSKLVRYLHSVFFAYTKSECNTGHYFYCGNILLWRDRDPANITDIIQNFETFLLNRSGSDSSVDFGTGFSKEMNVSPDFRNFWKFRFFLENEKSSKKIKVWSIGLQTLWADQD